MAKYYQISESELRELLHDSFKLAALENGGVDNWDWYGASINDFIENNGHTGNTIDDIVDRVIEEDYVGTDYE